MKKQTEWNNIPLTGCYLFCAGRVAEKASGVDMLDPVIAHTYAEALTTRLKWGTIIDWNCYIRYPVELIDLYLKNLGSDKRVIESETHEGGTANRPEKWNEEGWYVIQKWKTPYTESSAHFVVPNDYDPDPTVVKSFIMSERGIKIG